MINDCLVSIIVPVYNVEKYLNRCVDSVLNQTFHNYELLLIDDGSTDNSGEICDKYAQMHKNVFVIHKKNAGLGFARNSGIEKAVGKYICFIDGDDYVESDYLENYITSIKEARADTCIGGYQRVYNNKIVYNKNLWANKIYENEDIISFVLAKMFGSEPGSKDKIEMSVWKTMFSLDIINNFNIRFHSEREYISEDIVFDIDYYSHAQKVIMCADVGYCYCYNEESLTTKYLANRFSMLKKLYLYLCERTEEIGIYDIVKIRLMNAFTANVRFCIKNEVKYSKKIGKQTALKNIKYICKDSELNRIWNEFDQKNVMPQNKLINHLIKNNCVLRLWLIIKLKLLLKL